MVADTPKQLITNSRLASLRTCRRKHYYQYELKMRRIRQGDALRLGAAYHVGLDHYAKSLDQDAAIELATRGYATVPQWADATDWAVEYETVAALLSGHIWAYQADAIEFVATELPFQLPLINPSSGHPSRLFYMAGKIDAIVRLPDGRLAVLEYKTAGEDIAPDAEYWLRLRCDSQISLYTIAARQLGHDVATVLYDVVRKPTIRLRKDETPQDYGRRLLTDIGERPGYYFARREVPRLEDELAEFRLELWQQAQSIRDAQRSGHWYRNVGRMTCSYCDYAPLCLNSVHVNIDAPPSGFEILADAHPELSQGE